MSLISRLSLWNKLKMMLEEVRQVFRSGRKAVLKAYNQALSERFSPAEARDLLLATVRNVSRRTIYLYLPDESKDKKMQALAKMPRLLQNCSDNRTKKVNTQLPKVQDKSRRVKMGGREKARGQFAVSVSITKPKL
jgi:hypothetical protein